MPTGFYACPATKDANRLHLEEIAKMALHMSFGDSYDLTFGLTTPPVYSYALALADATSSYVLPAAPCHTPAASAYSRSSSYSQSPGPETPIFPRESLEVPFAQVITPRRSPIRSHGPLLLPKIRNQDQIDASPAPIPSAKRAKTCNSGSWRPGHTRTFTTPEVGRYPVATAGSNRSLSTLTPPASIYGDSDVKFDNLSTFRRASSVSSIGVDDHAVVKFGYPTYRAMHHYIESSAGVETFVPAYTTFPPRQPSPMRNFISFDDFTNEDFTCAEDLALDFDTASLTLPTEPMTTLQSYLTAPNPSPSLVRQLNIQLREPGSKHFWWDTRQIRPWTSFNTETMARTPGLSDLLNISLPESNLLAPSAQRNAQPETEAELLHFHTSFYAEKLNTALAVCMGDKHLVMKAVPASSHSANEPHLASNYTDDTSSIVFNRPSGPVVGLVLSFDRWNSSMRVEGNHRKVSYLRGLARLHGAMRDYGCRYGFIMTEIELLVVRNGSDATPNFGFLEVQSIPLVECARSRTRKMPPDAEGNKVEQSSADEMESKMTAMMALFYLHLLAKDVPLPNEPSFASTIGAPAEGTRRKHLPKDTWIPEPQVAEKREAKRSRGWVWPDEAVGRKEMGKRGIRYARC